MSKPRPMPSDTTQPRRANFTRALPLAAIAIVAVAGAFLLGDALSFETLAENREALIAFRDSHFVATALAFVAVYIVIVAFSLPGATVATLTGGFLFGLFPGVLFNVLGATIGACVIFLAARRGLGETLAARMDASEGQVRKIKAGIDANQWEMLFLIRLVPVVPFFVANLVPALVGVPLGRFAITTFLGIIPGGLVYTSVGSGLGEVLATGGTPDLVVIFEPHILLPLLGLCVLAALPIVLRAVRGRKED
ncbi:TVP38/TMEM64 family protein [Tropicimonas aquimaris]|uniref:TVP38/TMEM64 family membrane protein n=1 Tax=Tropicimonas aquimaris TaxID=914152 RepID=A0ABW3IRD7_9RHOB